MAIRILGTTRPAIVVFLDGAAHALVVPTVPPLDPQPSDEKTLEFPQVRGFRAEYSNQPITSFTKVDDEND
jgi:hypothetical protein